jgi:glycosyltransferase involved in cell wall biosynthesis
MRLSIITITFNNPELQKTLESVKSQTLDHAQFEHIVVDNLSSDDTKTIISQYNVTYIREADTGRYNAMNKGIKAATGDYLLFLNAGDCLNNKNVLSQVIDQLDSDIVYGNISNKSLANYPINKQFFIDRTIFHQAAFINKDLFTKYGLYDESLIISSDFDFFIKTIIKYHVSTKYIPLVISDYDSHGISSSNSDLVYQERSLVLSRYFGGIHLFKYFYYKYKFLFPKFIVNWQQRRLNSKPKI